MTRLDQSRQERPAGLTLRFGAERLRGRVHWPAGSSPSPLIFVLATPSDGDALGESLSSMAGAVVLSFAAPRDARTADAALGWAAEHAPDLGSDPRALVVAGVDIGGGLAVRLALAARDHGWPDLHRQLLVHPIFDAAWTVPANGTGLAPATVVTTTPADASANRYLTSLRTSRVEIDELHVRDRGVPQGAELDAVVRSLRLKAHPSAGR